MLPCPPVVVDYPLDVELADSILTMRKVRLLNLRKLLAQQEQIEGLLKSKGIVPEHFEVDRKNLQVELESQLERIESYGDSKHIYLEELEHYLELIARGQSSTD